MRILVGILAVTLVGCGASADIPSSAPASAEIALGGAKPGMSVEEVESAMGGPGVPVPGQPGAFRYPAGSGKVLVRFSNGAVVSSEVAP